MLRPKQEQLLQLLRARGSLSPREIWDGLAISKQGAMDLIGPAETTHGTQNLVGALRASMAALGARTIREMHQVEMVIAPAIATEGKSWQLAGRE